MAVTQKVTMSSLAVTFFHAASHIAVSLPGLLLDPALEVFNKGISFSQEEIFNA